MWNTPTLSSQSRIALLMDRLASTPPNCLLLEGGTRNERKELALYWAMSLNCRTNPGPCGQCPPCVQIQNHEFRDMFHMQEGKKVKIEEIRDLRPVFSQKPHFSYRLIIIEECQGLGSAPANALLKSLEEPKPGNSFILLAPQRENLFSTLVSRSFVLTLNRDTSYTQDDETEDLFSELSNFVRTGRGWLTRTMKKGGVDQDMAQKVILRCRHELIQAMIKNEPSNLFSTLSPEMRYQTMMVLRKAEDSISFNVRIDLAMEWLAVSIWKNLNRGKSVYRK